MPSSSESSVQGVGDGAISAHSHHTERTHRTSASAREAAMLTAERDWQTERIKELEARLAAEPSGVSTVPIAQAEAVVERVAGDAERKGMAGVVHVQHEAEAEYERMKREYELRISQATKQLQDQHLHLERVKNENNHKLVTLESQISSMTTQGQALQRVLMETGERAKGLEGSAGRMQQEGQALPGDKARLEADKTCLELEKAQALVPDATAPTIGGPPTFSKPVPVGWPSPSSPRAALTNPGLERSAVEQLLVKLLGKQVLEDDPVKDYGVRKMPKFESKKAKADEASIWLKRLEMAATDDGWFKKRFYFYSKLMSEVDDAVIRWTNDLDPGLLYSDRFSEFKEKFLQRFGRLPAAAMRDFIACKQGPDETVRSYAENVRALALEGGMRLDEVNVIYHFQNTTREPTRSLLKLECAGNPSVTFDQMIELAESLERTTKESNGLFFNTPKGQRSDTAIELEQLPLPWIPAERNEPPRQGHGHQGQPGRAGSRTREARPWWPRTRRGKGTRPTSLSRQKACRAQRATSTPCS